MSSQSDMFTDLQKITVYIDNKKTGERGTGFILKQSDNHRFAYFFTAKHVILGKNYQDNSNYAMPSILDKFDCNELDLKANDTKFFLYENKIFYLDVDISFGIIDLSITSLNDIKKIKISDYDFSSNYKYDFYTFGYPAISSEKYGEFIELNFRGEKDKKLLFSSNRNLGSVSSYNKSKSTIFAGLGGLSGSGVFLNKTSDYLHVNSLIVEADGYRTIIALSLLDYIDGINELIKNNFDEEIPILEMNKDFDFDNETIELDNIDYDRFKEKIGEIDEAELSPYENSRKVIDDKKSLEDKRKKLAQYCACLALTYNKKRQYHLSTRYFKYAVDLDISYKPLFLISKNDRSKYNEALVKVTDETLIHHDISYEDQYKLLKQKIEVLDGDKNEQYKAIVDFFNINQQVEQSDLTRNDIEKYLSLAKTIINDDIEKSLKSNYKVTAENYLYMAEVAELNKSFHHSVYFLYAARDLMRLFYKKDQSLDYSDYVNGKLNAVFSNEYFDHVDRSMVFRFQTDAEEKIRSFEKIKEESEAVLFNDVKDILQKLNDIYDKTNDSGILQEISKTIESMSRKINPDAHNQDIPPSDMQDEEKPNKKMGFGLRSVGVGLFIDVFLFIGMVGFLSGSAVNTVIG